VKLEGLRVLDLTAFLPGPYVTQMLADHGADVVKIESEKGEATRHIGAVAGEHTVYFRNTQRGKRSVVLDLKSDAGHAAFLELAKTADVIVEAFRPGVVKRLGIDYAAIVAVQPKIVYCSMTAFGQTGPYATVPSHDLGAEALTGVLALMIGEDGLETLPALPVADVALGSLAVGAIMMALYRRERTGEGDYIDLSMTDALISWTPHILGPVVAEGKAPVPSRQRLLGGAAFYRSYRTADEKYVVLSGAEMNFVANLLNALGRPDLIDVARLPPGEAQAPLRDFLTETFATRTRDEWDAWLKDKDVCYAPVLDMAEAWASPLLREREMIATGEDGIEYLGTPLKFRHEPGAPRSTVAKLGEHTNDLVNKR
jgi:crotonobetainyl-CoA:carnitine CoA-transferase CaiB-like acyl-CoA transferase